MKSLKLYGETKNMPQQIFPSLNTGMTDINPMIGVHRGDDDWTYFHGGLPIYSHRAEDNNMFRFITSQLIVSGSCRPIDIIKTFGVTKSSVSRNVKKLKEEGAEAFFKPGKKKEAERYSQKKL